MNTTKTVDSTQTVDETLSVYATNKGSGKEATENKTPRTETNTIPFLKPEERENKKASSKVRVSTRKRIPHEKLRNYKIYQQTLQLHHMELPNKSKQTENLSD